MWQFGYLKQNKKSPFPVPLQIAFIWHGHFPLLGKDISACILQKDWGKTGNIKRKFGYDTIEVSYSAFFCAHGCFTAIFVLSR